MSFLHKTGKNCRLTLGASSTRENPCVDYLSTQKAKKTDEFHLSLIKIRKIIVETFYSPIIINFLHTYNLIIAFHFWRNLDFV